MLQCAAFHEHTLCAWMQAAYTHTNKHHSYLCSVGSLYPQMEAHCTISQNARWQTWHTCPPGCQSRITGWYTECPQLSWRWPLPHQVTACFQTTKETNSGVITTFVFWVHPHVWYPNKSRWFLGRDYGNTMKWMKKRHIILMYIILMWMKADVFPEEIPFEKVRLSYLGGLGFR